MRKALEESKQTLAEETLSLSNRQMKESAVLAFRSKAVGQDIITEFETQLRTELSKKHKVIKNEFYRWCNSKAVEFLKPLTDKIRRKVNTDEFANFDEFKQALEDLKEEFNISGPKYTGSNRILAESC